MTDNDVRVYFDTEFTGLKKDADLISIGMVVNDPDLNIYKALYIEVEDYNKNKLAPWTKENVIPNLLFNQHPKIQSTDDYMMMPCNKKSVRDFVYTWLKGIHKLIPKQKKAKIQLVSDVCHYDFVLFLDLFGSALDLPEFISPICHDINYAISEFCNIPSSIAFDYSRENMIRILDDVFKLYQIPTPYEIRKLEEILPKEIKDKKHNALYDAYIISKLVAYMRDAYGLKIFE